MDNLKRYQEILQNLLQQYAHKPSHGDIEPEIIIDQEGKHYELPKISLGGRARLIHRQAYMATRWVTANP